MEEIICTGTIKMFNEKYGFIKYDKGEIFFHRKDIIQDETLKILDAVSFKIENSKVKKGSYQAVDIKKIEPLAHKKIQDLNTLPLLYGNIVWYDDKGFGNIHINKKDYFFHKSYVITEGYKIKKDKNTAVFFNTKQSPKDKLKNDACDVLIIESHPLDDILVRAIMHQIVELGVINSWSKLENLKIYLNIFKQKGKIIPLNQLKIEEQYHFTLWYNGYVSGLGTNIILEELIKAKDQFVFWEILKLSLSQINETLFQTEILDELIKRWDEIDNFSIFPSVKAVFNLKALSESAKFNFCNSILNKCDPSCRYLLWLNGFTDEVDINYILSICNYQSTIDEYHTIFKRLNKNPLQDVFLGKIADDIGEVDSFNKYRQLKNIFSGAFIPVINSIHLSNLTHKYISFIYNEIIYKDSNKKADLNIDSLVSDLISGENRVNLVIRFFERFHHQLFFDSSWITAIIGNFNLRERLEVVFNLSEVLLSRPYKNKYREIPLITLINDGELSYVKNNVQLFPAHLSKSIQRICATNLNKTEFKNSKLTLFSRRIETINAIIKSNLISQVKIKELYSNLGESLLNFPIEVQMLKSFKELLEFNEISIEFDLIICVVESHKEKVVSQLSACESVELLLILKNIKYLSENCFQSVIEHIYPKLEVDFKLKLWVHDLIDLFDYNSYCYFYFTLNTEERSIFNKKAKAIMGDALKQTMLKQREPWSLSHQDLENELEIYSSTWKSIWFHDGYVTFCMDQEPNFSNKYDWDYSEDSFNLLVDYITGKKLLNLAIYVKNNEILNVTGLEELEVILWKAKIEREIETGISTISKASGSNRIPVNILLRNQCIQLLSKFQIVGLEPTHLTEITFDTNKGTSSFDYSFLFSIPISTWEIAVIWESLELDKAKATHIFKCTKQDYEIVFKEIEEHLQSPKVRSMLNSNDQSCISIQKKLRYIKRIDHNNFDFKKWEENLYRVIPELLTINI